MSIDKECKDLIVGNIYVVTKPVTATNPLDAIKIKAGSSVKYLGIFNGFPMICAISSDGEGTNSMCPVIPSWLTTISEEVLVKAVELRRIYMGETDMDDAAVKSSLCNHNGDGYGFVRLAEEFLKA